MICDLSQPIFSNVPEWPKFRPTLLTVPQLTETESANVAAAAMKLIVEDTRIPGTLLGGSVRHFSAFPVLIEKGSGAWTRAVAWDEGEMA